MTVSASGVRLQGDDYQPALFLGHLWNRVPPTQIYEDTPLGYAETFFVPA